MSRHKAFRRISSAARSGRKVRRALSAVSVCCLLAAGAPAAGAYTLKAAGVDALYVVSGSMEPEFSRGDLVLSSRGYGSLQQGDVVAYRAGWLEGRTVTHRVVSITEPAGVVGSGRRLPSPEARIITQGDANTEPDPGWVGTADVRGEVVAVLPGGGWLLNTWTLTGLLTAGGLTHLLSRADWEALMSSGRRLMQKGSGRRRR